MQMTLKAIKSMFVPGQPVRVTREGGQTLTVHGNAGTTVLAANNGTDDRVIAECKSAEWVMRRADGKNIHTKHPRASEVIEARAGFLKFRYDNGVTISIAAA